jgi:hypothetical protein
MKTLNPANPANSGARPDTWLPTFLVKTFSGTISSNSGHVYVDFSTPNGYKFISVLGASSSGSVFSCYPEFDKVSSSGVNVWTSETSSSSRKVVCSVLYMLDS